MIGQVAYYFPPKDVEDAIKYNAVKSQRDFLISWNVLVNVSRLGCVQREHNVKRALDIVSLKRAQSWFGHGQNYLKIEENLKITIY